LIIVARCRDGEPNLEKHKYLSDTLDRKSSTS
jgi:hypothetical protein